MLVQGASGRTAPCFLKKFHGTSKTYINSNLEHIDPKHVMVKSLILFLRQKVVNSMYVCLKRSSMEDPTSTEVAANSHKCISQNIIDACMHAIPRQYEESSHISIKALDTTLVYASHACTCKLQTYCIENTSSCLWSQTKVNNMQPIIMNHRWSKPWKSNPRSAATKLHNSLQVMLTASMGCLVTELGVEVWGLGHFARWAANTNVIIQPISLEVERFRQSFLVALNGHHNSPPAICYVLT